MMKKHHNDVNRSPTMGFDWDGMGREGKGTDGSG